METDSFLEHAVRASLIDMLDKELLVVLRDGRKLIGLLRTFDQYSNVVLEECYERRIFKDMFADISMGLYLIRGENIVMMGDIDSKKEDRLNDGLKVKQTNATLKKGANKNKSGENGSCIVRLRRVTYDELMEAEKQDAIAHPHTHKPFTPEVDRNFEMNGQ